MGSIAGVCRTARTPSPACGRRGASLSRAGWRIPASQVSWNHLHILKGAECTHHWAWSPEPTVCDRVARALITFESSGRDRPNAALKDSKCTPQSGHSQRMRHQDTRSSEHLLRHSPVKADSPVFMLPGKCQEQGHPPEELPATDQLPLGLW